MHSDIVDVHFPLLMVVLNKVLWYPICEVPCNLDTHEYD